MAWFTTRLATSVHIVWTANTNIHGQTIYNDMFASTTWTRTRTILYSAKCLRSGPKGQAGDDDGAEIIKKKNEKIFYFIFILGWRGGFN